MRCLCLLPEVDTEEKLARDRSRELTKQLKSAKREEERVVKLLLLGTAESGKSTMTKQMRIIHIRDYTDHERCQTISDIRKNLRDAILSILGAMDRLHIPFQNLQSAKSAEYIMAHATARDNTYSQEFYQHVKTLWEDDGVQVCFRCSSQYQLIDSAKYLLDRVEVIKSNDYMPSDQDVLRCRTITSTILKLEFSVADGRYTVPFRVYDVGGQRGERQKWVQVFDMCTAILFLVDAGNFDFVLREDSSTLRLLEAAETFEKVWSNRWLRFVSIILFINKIDILQGKISSGIAFGDFINSVDEANPYYKRLQKFHSLAKIKDSEKREFVEAFPSPAHTRVLQTQKKVTTQDSAPLTTPPTHIQTDVLRTAVFIKRFFMFEKKRKYLPTENVVLLEMVLKSLLRRSFVTEELIEMPVVQKRPAGWHDSHTCAYYYTCAVDTDKTRKVLEGCKSLIIKKHMESMSLC